MDATSCVAEFLGRISHAAKRIQLPSINLTPAAQVPQHLQLQGASCVQEAAVGPTEREHLRQLFLQYCPNWGVQPEQQHGSCSSSGSGSSSVRTQHTADAQRVSRGALTPQGWLLMLRDARLLDANFTHAAALHMFQQQQEQQQPSTLQPPGLAFSSWLQLLTWVAVVRAPAAGAAATQELLAWMLRWGKAWRCASAGVAQAVRVQHPQPPQGDSADASEASSLRKTGRSSSPAGQRISKLVKEFSEHIRRAAETTTSCSSSPGRLVPATDNDEQAEAAAAEAEATLDRRVADTYLAVVVQPDIVQQLYAAKTHLLLWRLFHKFAQTSSSNGTSSGSGSGSGSGSRSGCGAVSGSDCGGATRTMAGSRPSSSFGVLDAGTATSAARSTSSSQPLLHKSGCQALLRQLGLAPRCLTVLEALAAAGDCAVAPEAAAAATTSTAGGWGASTFRWQSAEQLLKHPRPLDFPGFMEWVTRCALIAGNYIPSSGSTTTVPGAAAAAAAAVTAAVAAPMASATGSSTGDMTAWRTLPRSSVSPVVKPPSVGALPGSATMVGHDAAAGGWGAATVGVASPSSSQTLTAAATALAATSHRPCTIIAKGATKLVRVTPPVDLAQRPQFNWRQQPHDSFIQKLTIGERAAACADTLQLTSWTLLRKQQQMHQQVAKQEEQHASEQAAQQHAALVQQVLRRQQLLQKQAAATERRQQLQAAAGQLRTPSPHKARWQ